MLSFGRRSSAGSFAKFSANVESILRRSIVRAAQEKKSARFNLDQSIIECISALSANARDEDFEDLYHFFTESFQFTGVPVACDETDVDQVVVDLRSAFEEYQSEAAEEAEGDNAAEQQHTYLILDKTLQAFPWESLPCMRGQSVSRIPSMSFLRDRLDLASARSGAGGNHRIVVDSGKAAFVLNPGQDLVNTQKLFEPWLDRQQAERGWTGVVGRAPSELEMKSALENKDLLLYVGISASRNHMHVLTCAHQRQILWTRWRGTIRAVFDRAPPASVRHDDAVGLLVRRLARSRPGVRAYRNAVPLPRRVVPEPRGELVGRDRQGH